MNVYLATLEWQYEGGDDVGVFSTLAKAKAACQAHCTKHGFRARKLSWHRHNPYKAWLSDRQEDEWYAVVRLTLDKAVK